MMLKGRILLFSIVVILIIMAYMKYYNKEYFVDYQLTNGFYVQDRPDKQIASDMIQEIVNNLRLLIFTLYYDNSKENQKYKPYIQRVYDRIDNIVFSEADAKEKYTSYTVNKGEDTVYCLRSKKDFKLHDINIIMYVAIHEISHVACPEEGHTALFYDINKYFLRKAINLGIYKYDDYSQHPIEYCGITVNSQVLKD